jgi:hypothetical protein
MNPEASGWHFEMVGMAWWLILPAGSAGGLRRWCA